MSILCLDLMIAGMNLSWRSVQERMIPVFFVVLGIHCAQGSTGDDSLGMVRDTRAPFSSWAGKRSLPDEVNLSTDDLAQLIHELKELYMLEKGNQVREMMEKLRGDLAVDMSAEKRAPFSQWAGKRAAFSSWAGKRAPFSSWAGKRAPFSSWAGKRSVSSEEEEEGNVRVKRSSDESDEVHRERRQASFSPWGGKRSRFVRDVSKTEMKPLRRPARSQGQVFSAWGGKK